MSHVAKIEIEIRDLDALRAACTRLGFEFREDQKTYAWYGLWASDTPMPEGFQVEDMGKCEHAIRVPGASYEVGVVPRRDGRSGYTLMWDYYRYGGLAEVLGQGAGKLKQAYGIEAARRAARRAGHSCIEQAREDGSVVLRIGG